MFNIDTKDMYHCNIPSESNPSSHTITKVTSHSGNTSVQHSKEPAWRFDVCASGLDGLEPRQTNDTSRIPFQAQKRQTSFVSDILGCVASSPSLQRATLLHVSLSLATVFNSTWSDSTLSRQLIILYLYLISCNSLPRHLPPPITLRPSEPRLDPAPSAPIQHHQRRRTSRLGAS